jgi:hypothetical protein
MAIDCNVEYWRIGIDDELANSDDIGHREDYLSDPDEG